MVSGQRFYWVLVFALGVGLRLALFSGYGLGDDPNFFRSYFSILRSGSYNPADHYQMRFGLWVPVVGSMRLLGVTEAGFVGAITACSIVNLVLVYLLARQEWDRPWALLAMGLAAVYPLDVLCSTLFAPDMILATYCFTALWLYRKALGAGEGGASRMVWAAASALFLFFGFVSKPWVALVGPLFAVEAVRHVHRGWGCTLVTGGGFALLVAGYLGWQRVRFGDWLYHISVENPVSIFQPYTREILLDYPRMLFAPNMYGSYFAGYYPHALVLLAVVFVRRARAAGKWAAFFAIMLAGLVALPAHRE
ncbi:MAG TPA: glycosyltransferase family 39 protein, partial [Candidatus Binatia bacterium]|nr:glycosyltransferase family 39 protein [Candidatus Binatia bacterium]